MSGSMSVVADADPPGAGIALASPDSLRFPAFRGVPELNVSVLSGHDAAGAGIVHPAKESPKVLQFRGSCLPQGRCFPTGTLAATQNPTELPSNAITLRVRPLPLTLGAESSRKDSRRTCSLPHLRRRVSLEGASSSVRSWTQAARLRNLKPTRDGPLMKVGANHPSLGEGKLTRPGRRSDPIRRRQCRARRAARPCRAGRRGNLSYVWSNGRGYVWSNGSG